MTAGKKCKDCVAEYVRRGQGEASARRPAPHPGPRCATHWRAYRKQAKNGTHERRVQKEYGLEPTQYGQIYLAQGGRCAICQRGRGISRKLAVDHDHKTGLVRGLLDMKCNQMLGHLRDDPELAQRIIDYLTNPPAQQLGITAVHRENREEADGRG